MVLSSAAPVIWKKARADFSPGSIWRRARRLRRRWNCIVSRGKTTSRYFSSPAGRPQRTREATEKNLREAGYTEWEKAVLKPNDMKVPSAADYKGPVRCELIAQGYNIVVNTKPEGWTSESLVIDDLRPSIEHLIESFGWDRLLFGSDWPVCTAAATFSQWVDALVEITNFAGEENQKKLFRTNAERIYKLA